MRHRLGVIGIGKMGEPVAENLYNSGFDILVYARRQEVKARMSTRGIRVAQTLKQVGAESDVIIDILTDTSATWEVLTQEQGVLEGIRGPRVFIDMTTSDPEISVKLGGFLKERQIDYLDSPITGGVIGAKTQNLILMIGGNEETFKKCEYIFHSIGKKVFYLGKMGNGHQMKLIHNQLSHSVFLATCEAVILGLKWGLPLEEMIDVFNAGNARSYATEVRFPKFILSESYDAGASFKTVCKDIGIVVEKMKDLNWELPITKATFDYWNYAMQSGRADSDYTTIFRLMEEICSNERRRNKQD